MAESADPLEDLWSSILSREDNKIRTAFYGLEPEEQKSVMDHLKKMASEPGWHPDQCLSAQTALQALHPEN